MLDCKRNSVKHNQELIYLFQEKEPKNPLYNLLYAYNIKGKFDVVKFKKICDVFCNKHPEFFNNYVQVDDSIRPIFNPDNERQYFNYIRNSNYSNVLMTLSELKNRPINLHTDSVMQVFLFEIEENHFILAFKVHHICADAYSLYHWLEFMSEFYNNGIEIETLSSEEYLYNDFPRATEWYEDLIKEYSERFLPLQEKKDYFPVKTKNVLINKEKFLNQCKNLSVSEFVFHLALYSIFLRKYNGEDNICLSIPFSGRSSKKSRRVFGYMVNLQPLILDFSKITKLGQLLDYISSSIFSLLRNQNSSIIETQQNLSLQSGMNFNYAANYYKNKMTFTLGECETQPVELENNVSISPFTMTLREVKEGFSVCIEYANDNTWKTLTNLVASKYEYILAQCLDKDVLLSDLRLLREEEERGIVEKYRGEINREHEGKTVAQLFEQKAEEIGDQTAAVYFGERITYEELNRKANRIANHLRERGIGREDRVGIISDRSIEYIAGVMGILKAGGAYVPVNPEYPEERIRYMLEDSEAKLVVTEEKYKETVEKLANVRVETFDEAESGSGENPERVKEAEDLAVFLYTSGTTGEPKGAMLEEHNLVNIAQESIRSFGFGNGTRILKNVNISFDASSYELCAGLIGGCEIHITNDEIQKDLDGILKFVEEHGVESMFLTTSYVNMLLSMKKNVPECMKVLVTGGDLLRGCEGERRYRLINIYGPTETAVYATFCEVKDEAIPPIGKPVMNTNIYIVDREGKLCPEGVVGEIWIGGEGVGRGYINKEELTREKFIESPWQEGERIYKSGDLGRLE